MALRSPWRVGAIVVALVAAVAVVPAAQAQARPPFYEVPAALPDRNGDIVRAEPAVFYLDPLKLIKVDALVNRVMYRSTDREGTAIGVTGTVITPRRAGWAPGSGR